MTNEQLNNLFNEAKETPVHTSTEDVTKWIVAASIASAGSIGIAAKLKLLLTKKALIMLGSTLAISGITIISLFSFNSVDPEGKVKPDVQNTTHSSMLHTEAEEDSNKEIDSETATTVLPESQEKTSESLEVAPLPLKISPYQQIPSTTERQLAPFIQPIITPLPILMRKSEDENKEIRAVQSFKRIETSGLFNVYIKQGSKEEVIVEAAPELQDDIIVRNDGDLLILEHANKKKKMKVKKPTKRNIYITVVDIHELLVEGVGNVQLEDLSLDKLDMEVNGTGKTEIQMNCEEFNLEHNGVGKLFIKGNLDELDLNYAGVGDVSADIISNELIMDYSGVGGIHLQGSAKSAEMDCSGVGSLDAFDFKVDDLEVEHSGVGGVKVHALNTISIESTGIGKLRYKGGAAIKKLSKDGLGSVKEEK